MHTNLSEWVRQFIHGAL